MRESSQRVERRRTSFGETQGIYLCIGVGSYPEKFKNIRANLKMKLFLISFYFFREHTNPMRKKEENFSEELFIFIFWKHIIHLEIFCFEHSGRFFVPPKLFCSPTATEL